jgi:hypothetical protein
VLNSVWTAPYLVTFEPPADLKDVTHYSFTEPAKRELVEVGYGSIPNSASTAGDILSQRAAELEDLRAYDPAFQVDQALALPVGPFSGSILSFTAREKHFQFREWWAIALLDQISYVQIVYHASAMDAAAKNRVGTIIASVGPGDETTTRPTPTGFAWHRAGRISLLIPSRLTPPSAFVFASRDVSLSIAINGSPVSWIPPAGEVVDREMETGIVDGVPATFIRFVALRNPFGDDRRWAYRQGQIIFDDGVTVQVEGKAPVEQSGGLDEAFRSFIRNVRRGE